MNDAVMNQSLPALSIEQLKSHIERSRKFVLTTHVNPDGDALGSELAFAAALRQLGKDVVIFNHNATPENYRWMDRDGDLRQFRPDDHHAAVMDADCIVVLDTNAPDRLRSLDPFISRSKAVKIVIDHHLDPSPFADHYLIDDEATSTGEIVYRILRTLPVVITKDVATSLYAAIMTDTGSFKYPRTDPETHRIVAHLLECGANPTQIFVNIYDQWTPGRMRLLGEVLDSMKTAYDGKLAYVLCTQKMFAATGTTEVETDNFTSFPMSIGGVVVGILFNELPDGVKISFRSKGTIPVNRLANEFGGGGHLNAAGARLFNVSLSDTVAAVVKQSEKYIPME